MNPSDIDAILAKIEAAATKHAPVVEQPPRWDEVLAAEIIRLRAMTMWQPIETAPKDFEHDILVWGKLPDGVCHIGTAVRGDDCWLEPYSLEPITVPLTHWMSLPEPPR